MRILLVEDDLKIASFIVKGFKAEGYAVDQASNGVDGLHLVQESGCVRVHVLVPTGALLLGRNRAAALETATLLRGAGLGGRFVLEVDPPTPGHDTLGAAVSGKLKLAPGVHRVEVRKPGYFPVQRTVQVDKQGGGTVSVEAEMLADPR